MFALFLIGCAGIYLAQPSASTAASPAHPPDPLAARRQTLPVPDSGSAPEEADSAVSRAVFEPAQGGIETDASGGYGGLLAGLEANAEQYPDDAEVFSKLGQALLNDGRIQEAIPRLERAAALNPGRLAYRVNLGRALAALGRWEESVASYRQARQLSPDDYATSFNLALALHRAGNIPEAIEEYRKAVALDPNDESFRAAHGIGAGPGQQQAGDAAAYEDYLRLAPSTTDAERVRAWIVQLTDR